MTRRVFLAALVHAALAVSATAQGPKVPPNLPGCILDELVDRFGTEARQVASWVDLNADGQEEVVVLVVGLMACGTGGCTVLVFTPEGSGYRTVADFNLVKPPIFVAATSTAGWRDLVVHLGGGGMPSRDVLLRFDGTTWANGDPEIVVDLEHLDGAQRLFPDFQTWSDAIPFERSCGTDMIPTAAGSPSGSTRGQRGCGHATDHAETPQYLGDARVSAVANASAIATFDVRFIRRPGELGKSV